MCRTMPSLCGVGTLTHDGNFRAGCQSEQAGYIAGIPFSGGVAEWLKAHAWKACIRETVSWVRIPLPPPHSCSPTFAIIRFVPDNPSILAVSGSVPVRGCSLQSHEYSWANLWKLADIQLAEKAHFCPPYSRMGLRQWRKKSNDLTRFRSRVRARQVFIRMVPESIYASVAVDRRGGCCASCSRAGRGKWVWVA